MDRPSRAKEPRPLIQLLLFPLTLAMLVLTLSAMAMLTLLKIVQLLATRSFSRRTRGPR